MSEVTRQELGDLTGETDLKGKGEDNQETPAEVKERKESEAEDARIDEAEEDAYKRSVDAS